MSVTRGKQSSRDLRHRRVRAKVHGTKARPRLAVFRSNKYLSAQLIDDDAGHTLLGMIGKKDSKENLPAMTKQAQILGEGFAKEAKIRGVETVVFDRGGYRYAGAIKVFADSARAGGLVF